MQQIISSRCFLYKAGMCFPEYGDLVQIMLPHTRSRLVQQNEGYLYGCTFYGLEGLFRKDQPATLTYGRMLCDRVKDVFTCNGFFTSDELPRYGIRRAEIRQIFGQMGKEDEDGHLLVLCAYDRHLSSQIREFLISHFMQENSALFTEDMCNGVSPLHCTE
jgi:Glu-tRNA(Gln) amidotransferase subunit E-like FAD-binding protein